MLLPGACKAANPDEGAEMVDAGGRTLGTPQVTAPQATPRSTVAIRGLVDMAARVVIKAEDGSSTVRPVLPGGNFCIDVPLQPQMAQTFEIYGTAEDGRISPPAELTVAQDPGSVEPAGAVCDDLVDC